MIYHDPLGDYAAKILKPETIIAVNRCLAINRHGYKILDRWAISEPDKLRALEKSGFLSTIVCTQQSEEQRVLDSPNGEEQLRHGLTEHEVLSLYGVNMNIPVL